MEPLIEDFMTYGDGKRYIHFYKDGVNVDHGRWVYSRTPVAGDLIHPFQNKNGPIEWRVVSVFENPAKPTYQIIDIHYEVVEENNE